MRGVTGLLPGSFDLFHVGHLDVLRRAEASCDRLVAGVFTDELAEELWGRRPVVPLIERMEIVGNVRHVGRVVPVAEADLRSLRDSLGFELVFAGEHPSPEAVAHDLGVRVVRFDDVAETGSAVLRSALAGAALRTSVA